MLPSKKFFIKKDTIIDLLSFSSGLAAGALAMYFFSESIGMSPIIFILLCGFTFTGIVRIFFPYSRTPRAERKQLDAMSRKITEGAFAKSGRYRARLLRAVRLFHNNQFRRSLKILDKLYSHISNEQDRFAISFFTGMCCFKFGFYDDAIDEFRACLSVKNDPTVLSNLGNCYLKREMYDDAKELFSQAYALDPADPFASNGLALTLYKQNDFENALKYAEISLKLENAPYTSYAIAAVASARLKMIGNEGDGFSDVSEKYCKELEVLAPSYSKELRGILDDINKK